MSALTDRDVELMQALAVWFTCPPHLQGMRLSWLPQRMHRYHISYRRKWRKR